MEIQVTGTGAFGQDEVGFAGLVADELAVGAGHAVDPDARGAEVWHERPLVGGVDADLVRVAGLLAVGEGGVEFEHMVEDVGGGAEGAVVRDGEHGEGGAAVRGGDGPLAVLADVEVLRPNRAR